MKIRRFDRFMLNLMRLLFNRWLCYQVAWNRADAVETLVRDMMPRTEYLLRRGIESALTFRASDPMREVSDEKIVNDMILMFRESTVHLYHLGEFDDTRRNQ